MKREPANAPLKNKASVSVSAGHYLPSPVSCERLELMIGRCGGSLAFTPGEVRAEYTLPSSASEEIRDFLRPHMAVNLEPAYLARLPGGRVFGSGNVVSPDGKTIARDVSPDFGKPFEDHWLLTYKKIPPPVQVVGVTAVIATTLGVGYSHWLLEELPRLLALKSAHSDTLIAHAVRAYQRQALALAGFSGTVLAAKRSAHFACEQLTVPSQGPLTPTTVHAIEEFTEPLRPGSSSFGERLYVSRDQARRRRVANEPELWAELATRGFVKLHLEELTWPQQIAAFREAKVIVAPHGAGLANLVFCEAGVKVVEVFHRSYVNGCYWQLAALKALDYLPVVLPGPGPLAQMLSANRSDIEADIAQILRAL